MKQTKAEGELRIDHYKPAGGNYYPEKGAWKDRPWAKAFVYTPGGTVEVYSEGGPSPVTSLYLYVHPRLYHGQIPRHYKLRSFPRVARRFAEQCLAIDADADDKW